ncbi:hypothetical protein OG417_22820 [Actinoallomurus sp. NBC_01490]|uniref:hypothetical protein n=1 Tax=Actinoallomurus sp. NBC_01490 TaxID=2903557 RepID=UPI002E36BFDF|nr:hypothetical protein [Actinoallomurus sp. NBC_01490]
MTRGKAKPPTYLDGLLVELDEIHNAYSEILDTSGIINIDPNRRGDGVSYLGSPAWGWRKSDNALESARMTLLRRLHDWEPRFRLLFPHPTPDVSKRIDEHIGRLTA